MMKPCPNAKTFYMFSIIIQAGDIRTLKSKLYTDEK